MSLQDSAEDVIRTKSERDQAESQYTQARDSLYNELVRHNQGSYTHEGYTFTKREFREASRVNPHKLKELFMLDTEIPQAVKDRLIREAIIDTETAPGIAVYPPKN